MRWLRRLRWVLPVTLLVAVITVGWMFPIRNIGPPGDPGQRILHQLVRLTSAVPLEAHVTWRSAVEPSPSSCDGNPATAGWEPVTVEVTFTWHRSNSSVWRELGRSLHRLGWQWAPGGVETSALRWPDIGTWNWRTWLKPRRLALASLTRDPFGPEWTFVAEASSTLPPPSGC